MRIWYTNMRILPAAICWNSLPLLSSTGNPKVLSFGCDSSLWASFFCQKRPLVGDFPASWRVDYPQLAGWTWTWYQWYQWYRLVSPQLWVWNGGFCFQMAIEIWGGWCLRYILYIYIWYIYIYAYIYICLYIYNYIIYYNIILYYTILY